MMAFSFAHLLQFGDRKTRKYAEIPVNMGGKVRAEAEM
jgi:hypothetical protein